MRSLGRRICLAVAILFSMPVMAVQLTYGKYFGHVRMEGQKNSLAVSLDVFVTQIGDPTIFPQANAIMRVNLGGYLSHEYVGYHYYAPTFDFEEGVLHLEDPNNDLAGALRVNATESEIVLEGPVVYRPTQTKGLLRVSLPVDESRASVLKINSNAKAVPPFLSKLSGEYRGKCGKSNAAFQIETARELADNRLDNALNGYAITGRIGVVDPKYCLRIGESKPSGSHCVTTLLSQGLYNFYDNKLSMQGPHSFVECARNDEALKCTIRRPRAVETCEFSKPTTTPSPPEQLPKQLYLNVPPEKKQPLPEPSPPLNRDLLEALKGDFFGFVHHENRDIYQLIRMNVIATTFTDNDHIQNQVLVASTVSTYLGSSWDGASFSTHFPRRVFYLNVGFALQLDDADNFLVIGDWRKGYVRGVWYSRSYGRVGTFELIKDIKPAIPSEMKLPAPITAGFVGPVNGPSEISRMWHVQLHVPAQIAEPKRSGVKILGHFQMKDGLTAVESFENAYLDPNTGTLGMAAGEEDKIRLITGPVGLDGRLRLLWPRGPVLGIPMDHYQHFVYEKDRR